MKCSLESVPKEIIESIINEQMKRIVKEQLEEDKILDVLYDLVKKELLLEVKKKAPTLIKEELVKNNNKYIRETIDYVMEDDTPEEVWEALHDFYTEVVCSKLGTKKKGKK